MGQTHRDPDLRDLTLHIGQEDRLLERAGHTSASTDLVLAPVQLHRRNLQRRLREDRLPKDAFEFTDPADVARRVLRAVGESTDALDRIDRLSVLRSILLNEDGKASPSDRPRIPNVTTDPKTVEQLRSEVESVTNYHPERMDSLRGTADELSVPIDADSTALIDLAVGIERALRCRSSRAVSNVQLLRRATRRIGTTDGSAWNDAYPDIECVSLVGVSSVSATQADVLRVLLDETNVGVHVHFRRGTGDYLAERIPDLLDVADPGAVIFE
ncbi:hypothetical protein [Halorussus pelagicus]|uniref:hypothetical protein n=1 Tax=Halorussus pelagicus TaxID=2505977 RepID=UPI000FFB80F3|nr:hypothetical protein [Halorussus pelagicus]